MRKHPAFLLYAVLAAVPICLLTPASVLADVVTDGTLGPVRPLSGPHYTIGPELGRLQGPSLFHSFHTFDLYMGESAFFTGPDTVQRVIGRVTGGSASWIDGVLGCRIPGADLLLLNPSGVLFGPNASLDLSGSFHASTAAYVRMGDGGQFHAVAPAESVLTSAPPEAFGFLKKPEALVVGGALWVPDGKTLSLVGGDISIGSGVLGASGGRIELAAVGSAGEVFPTPEGLETVSFDKMGDIVLGSGSWVYATGQGGGQVHIRAGRFEMGNDSYLVAETHGDQDGGRIHVHLGGDLVVGRGAIVSGATKGQGRGSDIVLDVKNLELGRGGLISVTTVGSGDGGDLRVEAKERVLLTGTGLGAALEAEALGKGMDAGDGGDIVIATGTLHVTGGAGIRSVTEGPAKGGDLLVDAKESVTIDKGGFVEAVTRGVGEGGSVRINAADLHMDAGLLRAAAADDGDAGTIQLHVDTLKMDGGAAISGSSFWGRGRGADIVVKANEVFLAGGSRIYSATFGKGRGGTIAVNASGTVLLEGEDTKGFPTSMAVDTMAISNEDGACDAGDILVTANDVFIRNGALISSTTFGTGSGGDVRLMASNRMECSGYGADGARSGLSAGSYGPQSADAGHIHVQAGSLALREGVLIESNTEGSGQGGRIHMAIANHASLEGHVVVSTDALGKGDDAGYAGAIELEAGSVSLLGGARLSTGTAGPGHGGDIRLTVAGAVRIAGTDAQGSPSGLFAQSDGKGNAGTVAVWAGDVELGGKGNISTRSSGPGMGGDIALHAHNLRLSDGASVSAESTGTGDAGHVRAEAARELHLERALVTTSTERADGGNILVRAGTLVYMQESIVTASVRGGQGDGGNIRIDPLFVILDRSRIVANAFGGAGGNIHIRAGHFLATPDSMVQASSQLGIDGSVAIDSPETDMAAGITPLSEPFRDQRTVLGDPCAARNLANRSSLRLVGRGGMPLEPDDPLPGPWPGSRRESGRKERQESQ